MPFPQLTFRTKLLASHVGLVAVVVTIAFLLLNRTLGADLADFRIHPGEAALRLRRGLAADARTRQEMAVHVAHVNERDLGAQGGREQNRQQSHERRAGIRAGRPDGAKRSFRCNNSGRHCRA